MIGSVVTQPQGGWPGSSFEYGFFVSDQGFPTQWLQWLDRKILEYVPAPPHYWPIWRLQADEWDETTGAWIPFARGSVNFWRFHPPPYPTQCTVERILPDNSRETVSADLMSLPWAGCHLFFPEWHLTGPANPNQQYPYDPINRTFFREQRIRVHPPPLKT
ncbi:MAG: hypothetical protein HQL98_16160 [Magnetococcales bacterium]|nr:hypothetical protein [Magnetococcales bacterium]